MASKAAPTKRASKPAKKPAARSTPAKTAKTTARKPPTAAPSKRATSKARSARTTARPAQASRRSNARAVGELALDKLHQVALQAKNLDDAVDFYSTVLGLRFIARLDPPGLAFFDMGAFRLMLSATASEATLYFRVDDIDKAVKALKKRGVTFLHAPAMIHRDEAGELGKKGVEEWMAFFKDPSGNLLALTERR